MKIKNLIIIALAVSLFSCQNDDQQFGEIVEPSNVTLEAEIVGADEDNPNGDGSGEVIFTASADDALNYRFYFGDSTNDSDESGTIEKQYTRTGLNDYTVTVVASGIAGTSVSTSIDITVLSEFEDDEAKQFLTGGSSKTWYVASQEPGHLGVGPIEESTPDFFSATPGLLANCLYNDEITFGLDGQDITFDHVNQGVTFFNAAFLDVGGGGGDSDQCLPFDVSGQKITSLIPAESNVPQDETRGTGFTISDGGFMSYFINTSTYEILEISEGFLHIRALSGQQNPLAWYLKFTTNPDGSVGGEGNDNELDTQFTDLIWSDEFDQGPLDESTWTHETGNNNGWGNQEQQFYRPENTVVEDGVLKITAKSENFSGFEYTSSRLKTEDNFEFQYGRIEVRAKLPQGDGTWPAIWMLGSNFSDVGWPDTGEIDIMEHNGNEPGVVHGSLHFPGNFGGNAVSQITNVDNVSSEFHDYTVEWDEDQILFAVDGQIYHEFTNGASLPFNQPFFIILNVAMGGTFVGDIDPAFDQSTMEIDHVRVYQ